MPDRTARANAIDLSDEAAGFAVLGNALDLAIVNIGHARLIADALDARLLHTPDTDAAAAIALSVTGADAQLARARKLVADLQARRAEIAQTCAAMRGTLERP